MYADPAVAAGLFKGGADGADDRIDIKVRALQEDASRIEVVEGQEAVGQLGETFSLSQNDFEIVFISRKPRIEVSGERKSWDTFAINFF